MSKPYSISYVLVSRCQYHQTNGVEVTGLFGFGSGLAAFTPTSRGTSTSTWLLACLRLHFLLLAFGVMLSLRSDFISLASQAVPSLVIILYHSRDTSMPLPIRLLSVPSPLGNLFLSMRSAVLPLTLGFACGVFCNVLLGRGDFSFPVDGVQL